VIGSLRTLFRELQRRKVYHVAGVYAVVAFVVWQVADIAFPSLGLPDSATTAVLVFTVLGFPIALVLAWAYEVRPEASTVDAQSSRTAPKAPAALSDAVPVPQRGSVAILPFASLSAEPESEYFADGVTEEITNVLAGLAHLHVAARTSAFAFKGQQADIREIARRLNVSYVVEGSVRRARDTVRITAQLIDASTGYHLWSQRFDRNADGVFEIQDEIARAVADRLHLQVRREEASPGEPGESGEPGGRGTPVPRPVARSSELGAYDAYLKGRQLLSDFAVDAVVESTARFEEALAIDPDFAAAHAGMAEALTLQSIGFQIRPERETMPRAIREAEAALALDANLPEAHLARGLGAMFYEWDHRAAGIAFERALELGPNVARVHMWREFYHTYVENDYEAAIAANRRAQDLNPLDPAPRSREGTCRYLFGDYEQALDIFRSLLEGAPRMSVLHAGMADTLTRLGRIDEAVQWMEQAVEYGGPTVAWLGILGALYGLRGDLDKGRQQVRQLEARAAEGYVSNFWLAIANAGLGDMDAAFSCLDRALADRDGNLLYTFHAPREFGLRDDPRIARVLRAIGLSHLIPAL
jgi:serine/threonine-protein kinase